MDFYYIWDEQLLQKNLFITFSNKKYGQVNNNSSIAIAQ